MNYEQAVNYLKSSGMSEEQIAAIVNGIKSELIETIVNTVIYSEIDVLTDLLVELKETT